MKIKAKESVESITLSRFRTGQTFKLNGKYYMVTPRKPEQGYACNCVNLQDGTIEFITRDAGQPGGGGDMTQTKLQSRFHLDSESGFVRDRKTEQWLTTAEEVYEAMMEEGILNESYIGSMIKGLSTLRKDLFATLGRFPDYEQDARMAAYQDHARARAEHNEQEEA